MIKARIRWCSCRVENILTLGKLLRLWFCFLLHSILFLISQTSYPTYKRISRYELARPIMGTIFLVGVSGEGEVDFLGREMQIFLEGGPSTAEGPVTLRLACFRVTGTSM